MFDSSVETFITTFLLIAIGAIIALLPALIPFHRRHQQRVAILLVNILLGFTGIGWIVALVWAATAVDTSQAGAPR